MNYRQTGTRISFDVSRSNNEDLLSISLNMPGRHNALNATAAIAIASDEGINDSDICAGIEKFSGVGRRFDIQGKFSYSNGEVMLIDDYGHHPTEVAATIKALREGWPNKDW